MKYFEIIFDIPLKSRWTYSSDAKMSAAVGKRAMCPFGRSEKVGFIISETDSLSENLSLDPSKIKAIKRVVDKEPVFGAEEIDLSSWIADYYFCSHGEALSAMIPSARRQNSFSTIADEIEDHLFDDEHVLSDEQESALNEILKDDDLKNKQKMFYLFGITGSGKTEVFLKAAQNVLTAGNSVIYLVPEISLTYQTAASIKKRFGSIAATFHSGLSASERFNEWLRIRRGEARIVVGPRSAVFAPAQNLSLIIIDEEHDSSYKGGNTPRYHARQVAMRRCSKNGAKLLMGSATPSLESWKLMNEGLIKRLCLTKRLSGGSIAQIKPVSILNSGGLCLTPELKNEIRKTAQEGKQTILFLNRRGFAYYYFCPTCGYELKCKNCSVSLTYHKSTNTAVCHYCGYKTTPPAACPSCSSLEAGFMGFGTEKIEQEIISTFPDLRVKRVDADSMEKKGELENTLTMFKSGFYDILLGTQMVAKGLNFPKVKLVGIVFADTGLQMPDFRAAERVFSLIVQVAGRAGRFSPDGKVILQTFRPKNPLIVMACAMDVKSFYEEELKQRSIMNFPPFSRLIRFVIRSKDTVCAENGINRLAALLKPLLGSDADMLGPSVCPLEMIALNHRRHIIIRGKNMSSLHAAAAAAIKLFENHKDAKLYLEVDVDPVNVL
ncbi:MAG: primosomal protein N' [Termitinemataceae bacterium]|nr:MAG: primosomal protein N' [Termitinemataceae bacterium]